MYQNPHARHRPKQDPQDKELAIMTELSPTADKGSIAAAKPVAPTIEALGRVVGGMSQSIDVAFQNMAQTVATANNMAASLNTMMESVVIRSIHIAVQLMTTEVPGTPRPVICVNITNRNPMDLVDNTIKLSVVKKIERDEHKIFAGFSRQMAGNPDDAHTDTPVVSVPLLEAGGTFTMNWTIALPSVDQYNLRVSISTPSPVHEMTGRILHTSHVSGIYMIYQCTRSFKYTATDVRNNDQIHVDMQLVTGEVPATLLRDLFCISPLDALPIGSSFTFNFETRQCIQFRLTGIGESSSKVILTEIAVQNDADFSSDSSLTATKLLQEMRMVVCADSNCSTSATSS
eukprot:CFRG0543T1